MCEHHAAIHSLHWSCPIPAFTKLLVDLVTFSHYLNSTLRNFVEDHQPERLIANYCPSGYGNQNIEGGSRLLVDLLVSSIFPHLFPHVHAVGRSLSKILKFQRAPMKCIEVANEASPLCSCLAPFFILLAGNHQENSLSCSLGHD